MNDQHTSELFELLGRGEREIEAAESYDLDTVLSDADALLEEMEQ